jgi:hypothetical protein
MSCIFKNALPLAQTSTTYFYRTPFHFALPPKIQTTYKNPVSGGFYNKKKLCKVPKDRHSEG